MNRLITPKKLSNRGFVIPVLMFAIPLLVDLAASCPEAVGRKPGGYLLRRYAISTATPPTRTAARRTRSRLTIHAMPIPKAAH